MLVNWQCNVEKPMIDPLKIYLKLLTWLGNNGTIEIMNIEKEAMPCLPMITGQSVKMCELELLGSMGYFSRKVEKNP